jgi:hypothetical protein
MDFMEAFSLSERKVHVSKGMFDTAHAARDLKNQLRYNFFSQTLLGSSSSIAALLKEKDGAGLKSMGLVEYLRACLAVGGGGPQSPLGQRWKKKRGRGAGGRRQPREPP